jgi:hypothetical protein
MVVGVNLQEREDEPVEKLSPQAQKNKNLKVKLKNLEIKQAYIRNNSR